jgi:preprotein translocase subunit SecF
VSQEDGILVRFEESEKPDKVKEAIKKQQVEWARESANQDIKDALLALDVATTEKAGGYLNVTLAPVRGDAKAKEKVFAVVETARIEGRAGGAISRQTTFGAQVAGEMWRDAIIALIIANLGIFMYLWFRFEFSGGWGFGAIMAVIHDASVAAGAVIVANLLGWPILIDLNTVAALLTIIGFSVNDTVVIFDRIREVKAAHPTRTYEDIVNEAVNATLGRTVLTTTTVLLANISLLVFGGPTIRGLAFTLLIGFIVGTYSTVFIASPLMIWWYRRFGSGQAPLPTRTTRPTEEAAAGAEV